MGELSLKREIVSFKSVSGFELWPDASHARSESEKLFPKGRHIAQIANVEPRIL
jgi:hypothetical protein